MSVFFKKTKDDKYKTYEIFGIKLKFSRDKKPPLLDCLSTNNQYLKELLFYKKLDYLIKDGIFSFYYEDNLIHFYLPAAHKECIQKHIFEDSNFYEYNLLGKMRKYIPENAVVMDAGANIGNHTIYFSKICKAQKVYSFEPMKTVFDILKRNVEINSCQNKTELFNFGLGGGTLCCN